MKKKPNQISWVIVICIILFGMTMSTVNTPTGIIEVSAKAKTETKEEKEKRITAARKRVVTSIKKNVNAEEFNAEDIKSLGKYKKKTITPIWKAALFETLYNESGAEIWNSYLSSVTQRYIDLFKELYGTTYGIKKIVKKKKQLDSNLKEIKELNLEKYGFDVLEAEINDDMFYIMQRLEPEYSDSIIGDIQKAYKDYTADESSDWVAYNVLGSDGVYYHGEDKYVIHSNTKNPFNKSGEYDICYVDTGVTNALKDSAGFVYDAPVYQLVDSEELGYDMKCYSHIEEDMEDTVSKLYELIDHYQEYNPDSTVVNTEEDDSPFVFSDSDTRYLTEEDCEGLSEHDCKIARNEIYARHGRMFSDADLQSHFDSCSWYSGKISSEDFDENVLNDIEKKNLSVISDYEVKMEYN